MGKRTVKRRNRKTRRRKLNGGKSEAELHVWKDPNADTFQTRLFLNEKLDLGQSVSRAAHQLRWFDGNFMDTIPRNNGQAPKSYVKYLTSEYVEPVEGAAVAEGGAEGGAENNVNIEKFQQMGKKLASISKINFKTIIELANLSDLNEILKKFSINADGFSNKKQKANAIASFIYNTGRDDSNDADML